MEDSSEARVFENGEYFYEQGRGVETVTVSGVPAPYMPRMKWQLTLGNDRYDLDDLRSWTDLTKSRFFSGRGVYESAFHSPPFAGLGAMLDLGRVHETADVRINGQPVGVVWMRPYRFDVSRLLRPGLNKIRVDVTNLLINQILGSGPIDYSAVYAKYGQRFPPGDEWDVIREPLISGLLGPVRLAFFKLVRI